MDNHPSQPPTTTLSIESLPLHDSDMSLLKKGQIHRGGRGERGDFLEKARSFRHSSFVIRPFLQGTQILQFTVVSMLSEKTTMKVIQKKVCLLGDFAVGKTSLVRRFVEGRFDDRYLSTIGVKISRKTISRSTHNLNLLLWDLAGSEEYSDTQSGYLRGAAGALLVCDLTREGTLPSLAHYATQLRQLTPTSQLIILANKSDLIDERRIELADLQNMTTQLDAHYFLTSAKTGDNVEEAFHHLADLLS